MEAEIRNQIPGIDPIVSEYASVRRYKLAISKTRINLP